MTCNNIILAKPEAGASVPYTLPEGESARLSFGPEDIAGISMTPQGGLVIDFLQGGELTLTNFQSMVDGGNLLYLADGTLVDPAVLQAAVASNIETASGEGDATVIGIPAKDTTQEYSIESGKDYVLDFDINTPVNAVKQNGDFIMTFENGGLVVLRGYDVAMASGEPAKLTTTSDVCVYEGDELITNIQQLAAAPTEELLIEEEVEEEVTAKSTIQDGDLDGIDDVGPGDETALGYNAEEQVADIEPAAGDEVAEQLAMVEPAAGEPGSSNSGYGFNSTPGTDPLGSIDDTGPIDPTALGYRAPAPEQDLVLRRTPAAAANPAPAARLEVLDESNLDTNNPLSVSNRLVVDFGNDTPGRILPNGTFTEGGSLDNGTLSHEGSPITVTLNAAGDGYEGRDANGTLIFDFTIDQDTGDYTFNLYETLDHADATNDNDIISLDFGVVAIDADNDQVNTVIRVSILDDAPVVLGQVPLNLDETNFDNVGGNVVNGTFLADIGEDTPGSYAVSGNHTVSGSTGGTLTSGGDTVAITFDTATNTYTGTAGGNTVFTLVFNPATQQYTYTQFEPFDHADGTNPDDVITLNFGINAIDFDEDATEGFITINVIDDAPVAVNDARSVVGNNTVNGNVTNNDEVGEDAPGTVISVTLNGVTTVLPTDGSNAVINGQYGTLTINNTGVYSYTGTNSGTGTDVFTYTLRDFDGDTDTADLSFTVSTDDQPIIVNGSNAVDETDMNPTTSVSGTVDVNFGGDTPGTVYGSDSFTSSGSQLNGALTSNGQPVTVTYDAATRTYTGTANGAPVFTLLIEADGDYTFTLIEPLDHADPNDPNDIINLQFGITAEDQDGDTTDGHITIQVLDDVPQIGNSRGDVDETNLDQGSLVFTSTVTSVSGADVSNVSVTGTSSSSTPLTSNGNAVTITSSGNTYTGTANGATIFTLTLDPATGKYVYTQFAQLDHPDASDHNDTISINFGVQITEVDGDVANGNITIDVADDGPVANDDVTGAEEGQVITGNLLTNDELSNDGPNTVTNVTIGGNNYAVPAGGSATVPGQYGSLVINSDGTYTYTANGNNPDGTDTFTYTLRDRDGDTDTATLSVEVTPDGEPVAVYGDNLVDESNMVANNGVAITSGQLTVDFGQDGAGSVGVSDPNGSNAFSFSGSALGGNLTHQGAAIDVSLTGGNTFIGTALVGGVGKTIFTLTVNADGSYTFELYETLDHANGSDPNDVITLSFGVTATDADGDTAEGRLDIEVYDDAPVAYDDVTSAEEGQLITGNVLENDALSQDDTNYVSEFFFLDATGVPAAATIPLGGSVTVTTQYGEMTLNSDGTYTYVANDNDPDGTDTFTYRLIDSDGDSDLARLDIRVTPDGTPVAVSGEGDRDETTDLGVTLTETIDVNFGTATPSGIEGNGGFTFGGSTAATLTSNGLPVTVAFDAATQTYTGSTTNGAVFTMIINNNGTYSFTLLDTLDHADVTDPNDAIHLHFGLDAVDVDGNAVSGDIDITVYDDAPVAYDDGTVAVVEAQTVTGNVTTNDDLSEDLPNAVVEVVFNGAVTTVPANGANVSITGQYGTLTINNTGAYSYTANANNPDGTDTFTYVLQDGEDGDRDTAEISFDVNEIDDQPIIVTENNQVDETNMNPATSVSGTVDVNFGGDGPGTVAFVGTGFTSSTALTSNGNAVTVSLSGNTYTGTANGVTVFTATINPSTGAYTFTLNEPLDHPDASNPNDTINLDFPIRATDADGDVDNDRLRITVYDDGPVIENSSRTVDETNMNPTTAVSGTVTHDFGEDGAGVIRGTATGFTATGSVDNNNLSSEGSDVTVAYNAGTNTYTGTAADGRVVFTLQINSANGNYTFTLLETLDHADDMDPDDILNLNFPIEIVDYDGDVDPGVITINVKDDGPTIGDSSGTVDESNFGPGDLVYTGTVPNNGGTSTIDPNGNFTSSTTLTSGGTTVTVTQTATGYTGTAGGSTVFTITIDPNTGAYTYTQYENLDHPNTTNHNDSIELSFGIKVEGAGGNVDNATIKINVLDDGPDAIDDIRTTVSRQTITGNVVNNDDQSTDMPNTVTKIIFGGVSYDVPANGSNITISGTYGSLTINNTGSYTYVAGNNNPGGLDTFTYTLRDRDGDTDNAKLYITVSGNDQPDAKNDFCTLILPSTGFSSNVLSNDSFGQDGPGSVKSVTYNGTVYNLNGGAQTIAMATGTLVISANGAYSFTVKNQSVPTTTENLTITVQDKDGDTDTSVLQVNVIADANQGSAGNDTYNGTANGDYFDGNDGDDWIYGQGGNDELHGGNGNDQVEGGRGNDVIHGDAGNDLLIGREDDDTIYGGDGNDDIYGDGGLSVTYAGNDTLYGGAGDDYMFGGGGNDTIDGGTGHDEIYGGTGSDTIQGGDGNDLIYGDNGLGHNGVGSADTINGGAGNDHIIGQGGNDVLYGGSGADTFWFLSFNDGRDTIKDFSRAEGDKLELSNIITNYDHGSEDINNFLTAVHSGGNTTIYANNTGNGAQGSALVVLEGVTVSINDLMNGGHIIH